MTQDTRQEVLVELKFYRSMRWRVYDGKNVSYIPLRDMETSHIITSIRMIKNRPKVLMYAGITSNAWLEAFSKELAYRDEMVNKVLEKFPRFFKENKEVDGNRFFIKKPSMITTRGLSCN